MEQWTQGAVYNRRFIFRFGDCNTRKEASIYTVMKLLSEIAGEDYENRGLGHKQLWDKRQVFLLSRMSLRFHRAPRYEESVIASAWARQVKGPMFYRDFEIKGESGELLISGASAWLVADPESREILRPSVLGELPEMDSRCSVAPECRKLRRNPALLHLGDRKIYYSDLDSNVHVNNAVYGKIAVDFLPEEYRSKGIQDFYITFNLETRPGETLSIYGGETQEGYEVQGSAGDGLHFATLFSYIE